MFSSKLFALAIVFSTPVCRCAQTTAPAPSTAPTPSTAAPAAPSLMERSIANFTADQRHRFLLAMKSYLAKDYAQALTGLRPLLPELVPGSPGQVYAGKFAAESAIDTGDLRYARSLLEPMVAADPGDWRAGLMLARVYGESGEKGRREALLAKLKVLHPPSADAPSQADWALIELSTDQVKRFQTAEASFQGEHYAEALAGFRPVLEELPAGSIGQVYVAKFAAESAINTGDRVYARSLVDPMVAADPNDWLAGSLLARLYAEGGEREKRDAELTKLIELHRSMPDTAFGKTQQILLERVALEHGSVRVWYSLEPWGNFKTYIYSRIYDAQGEQLGRVTLESSDFDQPLFVKEHPEMAAKGMRRFSLDGYGVARDASGKLVLKSHATYGFYDGQPTYDLVRTRTVEIAAGQIKRQSESNPSPSAGH